MVGRSIGLIVLYIAGLVGLGWWSLTGLFGGAPKEDWALLIVLPLAWLFSFWPIMGSLLVALRWRSFIRGLEEVDSRLKSGQAVQSETRAELVETLVELAAKENGVPRFIARRFVEKAVEQAATRAGAQGTA